MGLEVLTSLTRKTVIFRGLMSLSLAQLYQYFEGILVNFVHLHGRHTRNKAVCCSGT